MNNYSVEVKERDGRKWVIVLGLGYGCELTAVEAERLIAKLREKVNELRRPQFGKPFYK